MVRSLRQVLKRCQSDDSAGCHRGERDALEGLAHSASKAADAVGHVSALGRVVKRRSYPILDGKEALNRSSNTGSSLL